MGASCERELALNVINLPTAKNYAYCAECEEQTFFMLLDDDDDIIGAECATCRSASEFEVCMLDVEFIPEFDLKA